MITARKNTRRTSVFLRTESAGCISLLSVSTHPIAALLFIFRRITHYPSHLLVRTDQI